MPEMIMYRTWTVRSNTGHTIKFKKGKPTHVADIMQLIDECRTQGAEFADRAEDASLVNDEDNVSVKAEPTGTERFKKIRDLMSVMQKDPNRHRQYFNSASTPKADYVAESVGFAVTQQEVNATWRIVTRPKTEEELEAEADEG